MDEQQKHLMLCEIDIIQRNILKIEELAKEGEIDELLVVTKYITYISLKELYDILKNNKYTNEEN